MAKTKKFTITVENQPGALANIAKNIGEREGEHSCVVGHRAGNERHD